MRVLLGEHVIAVAITIRRVIVKKISFIPVSGESKSHTTDIIFVNFHGLSQVNKISTHYIVQPMSWKSYCQVVMPETVTIYVLDCMSDKIFYL